MNSYACQNKSHDLDEKTYHVRNRFASLPSKPGFRNLMTLAASYLKGMTRRLPLLMLAVFVCGLIIIMLNVRDLKSLQLRMTASIGRMEAAANRKSNSKSAPVIVHEAPRGSLQQKQVWMRAHKMETGYLKHVTGVLSALGYSLDGAPYSDWNVLWTHEYPYNDPSTKNALMNLKSYQKVNKLPGTGFVTSKVQLATTQLKHVPLAFKMPQQIEELKVYASKHPNKMFVQKGNKHRGVRIKAVKDLDFTLSESFVQEFVDRPLLIDKRKFDIGIYTIITSINPFRIYIVEHDMLIRFCAKDYYPFDSSVRDKYVVVDDYTPLWEIPSLAKYTNELGFNGKQSFNLYMESQGKDVKKMYQEIEETIREVYLKKEEKILRLAKQFKSPRNFFEMVRFDFVVDENMQLYLMEVNMSPNLSSNHFTKNKLLYEQVLYNLFSVTGIAHSTTAHYSRSAEDVQDMTVATQDIAVEEVRCYTTCKSDCSNLECSVCQHCLKGEDRLTLKDAYLEHVNRISCKRVLPPRMEQSAATSGIKPKYWPTLSDKNKMMHLWFVGKCKLDSSWC